VQRSRYFAREGRGIQFLVKRREAKAARRERFARERRHNFPDLLRKEATPNAFSLS